MHASFETQTRQQTPATTWVFERLGPQLSDIYYTDCSKLLQYHGPGSLVDISCHKLSFPTFPIAPLAASMQQEGGNVETAPSNSTQEEGQLTAAAEEGPATLRTHDSEEGAFITATLRRLDPSAEIDQSASNLLLDLLDTLVERVLTEATQISRFRFEASGSKRKLPPLTSLDINKVS
jgi:hypothetical protein